MEDGIILPHKFFRAVFQRFVLAYRGMGGKLTLPQNVLGEKVNGCCELKLTQRPVVRITNGKKSMAALTQLSDTNSFVSELVGRPEILRKFQITLHSGCHQNEAVEEIFNPEIRSQQRCRRCAICCKRTIQLPHIRVIFSYH